MVLKDWGTTGRKVPAVGQGTWKLEGAPRAEALRSLERGLELGLTHVDTAEMYGDGRVEELVGEALSLSHARERVFLVSKVLPSHASFGAVRKACERSLRRLRTDHLDCYLLHWRGPTPLEETFSAFEALQEEGKIASWGVSNFDVEDMEEGLAIAGEGRIACNQVLYHLEERTIEARLVPWCDAHRVSVVGYSPFGAGRFPSATSPGGRALREVAQARGVTPRQVALAFLTRLPWVFAIPKASSVKHVEENAAAGSLVLDDAEVARIDAAFAYVPGAELPML